MTTKKRTLGCIRKAELLKSAIRAAREIGYQRVNRAQIAEKAGCAPTLLNHYFDTMPQLRRAIMGEAIRIGDLDIIAQGIIAKDSRALKVSEEIKQKIRARI